MAGEKSGAQAAIMQTVRRGMDTARAILASVTGGEKLGEDTGEQVGRAVEEESELVRFYVVRGWSVWLRWS